MQFIGQVVLSRTLTRGNALRGFPEALALYDVQTDSLAAGGVGTWTIGLLVCAATWVVGLEVYLRKRPKAQRRTMLRAIVWGSASILTLSVVGTIRGQALGYSASLAAIRSGNCVIVEGNVEQFVPMPPGGHADEQFVVDGVPFYYSGFAWRPGLHLPRAKGGPVEPGRYVRICYRRDLAYGNVILRVEGVPGPPSSSAPDVPADPVDTQPIRSSADAGTPAFSPIPEL